MSDRCRRALNLAGELGKALEAFLTKKLFGDHDPPSLSDGAGVTATGTTRVLRSGTSPMLRSPPICRTH